MKLIQTSIFSAIASAIGILSGLIVTKIIAIFIGPSGIAFIGQFQNFVSLVLNISGNAFSTAITKYTAEYHSDSLKKYKLWSATIAMAIPISLLCSILVFNFSSELSMYLLHEDKYHYIFRIFSLTIPFFLINTLLMSILNGHKEIRKYIFLNIFSSICSLCVIPILTIYLAFEGVLLAHILGQVFITIIVFIFIKKESWLRITNFTVHFNMGEVKKIFGFAIITFTAVSSSLLMMLIIRSYLVDNFSVESAGYWQSIMGLSQALLGLITTSLATYFLPTLSLLTEQKDISNELRKGYFLMMPVVIIISLSVYILREPIILILYTEQFMPMKDLFAWQFIGNIIKVAAWLLGYLMVAKAMVKITVSTEVIFALMFILLTKIFTDEFGLVGVTYAYALNAFLHLITMIFFYHYKMKRMVFING
ncbi:MAG: hypothetical protein COA95_01120 [Methylophaga sp.]|nr:MAG: hypothetical protein COA95_01120 [Methylophaga sp.]